MREVIVSNVYSVTQISKVNNTPWEKLMAIAAEEDTDIMFDFDGIELEEPWNNLMFKKMMQNPNVHLQLYSSEKTKDTINMMCLMGNLKPGRVLNKDIIIPNAITGKDKQIIALAKRFEDNIKKNDSGAELNICDVVDQLGSVTTVDALEMAIKGYADKNDIKEITVGTESIFIQVNIIERLAALMGTMKETKGITLKIESEDEDTAGHIRTYQCISGTAKLTERERAEIFNKNVTPGTVGMLSKFRDTKGRDAFGRKGNGEPVICRPCIYRGIKKVDGHYVAVIRQYNGNTFFTKLHYRLEHDGEDHPGLTIIDSEIPINDIGLANMFVGALYHFNFPIQYRAEDYISTYRSDGDDSEIRIIKRNLPEHIKSVLDDFGVKYDNMALIHAIGETYRFLRKVTK